MTLTEILSVPLLQCLIEHAYVQRTELQAPVDRIDWHATVWITVMKLIFSVFAKHLTLFHMLHVHSYTLEILFVVALIESSSTLLQYCLNPRQKFLIALRQESCPKSLSSMVAWLVLDAINRMLAKYIIFCVYLKSSLTQVGKYLKQVFTVKSILLYVLRDQRVSFWK